MRELPIPPENDGDDQATEMARVWLGNGTCNISLLLGMYEDADDCDVDELWAWGNILSDIAQHIANGLKQSHGWDETETVAKLRRHFNDAIKQRTPNLRGQYFDD